MRSAASRQIRWPGSDSFGRLASSDDDEPLFQFDIAWTTSLVANFVRRIGLAGLRFLHDVPRQQPSLRESGLPEPVLEPDLAQSGVLARQERALVDVDAVITRVSVRHHLAAIVQNLKTMALRLIHPPMKHKTA